MLEQTITQRTFCIEPYKPEIKLILTSKLETEFDRDGQRIVIRNLAQDAQVMSSHDAKSMKRKVFHKLAKYRRMRDLERRLGLLGTPTVIEKDSKKSGAADFLFGDGSKHKDCEWRIKAYMTAWEGRLDGGEEFQSSMAHLHDMAEDNRPRPICEVGSL